MLCQGLEAVFMRAQRAEGAVNTVGISGPVYIERKRRQSRRECFKKECALSFCSAGLPHLTRTASEHASQLCLDVVAMSCSSVDSSRCAADSPAACLHQEQRRGEERL